MPLGWACGLAALFLASPTPRVYVVGLAFAALGELVRIWASGFLDKNARLTVGGPYAWTRNPLYFGSLWVGLGFAVATGRPALLGVVVILFVWVYAPVMKREAARLADAFPDAYRAYAARTPFFWPLRAPSASAEHFSWSRVVSNREHWTVLGWLAAAAMIGYKLL